MQHNFWYLLYEQPTSTFAINGFACSSHTCSSLLRQEVSQYICQYCFTHVERFHWDDKSPSSMILNGLRSQVRGFPTLCLFWNPFPVMCDNFPSCWPRLRSSRRNSNPSPGSGPISFPGAKGVLRGKGWANSCLDRGASVLRRSFHGSTNVTLIEALDRDANKYQSKCEAPHLKGGKWFQMLQTWTNLISIQTSVCGAETSWRTCFPRNFAISALTTDQRGKNLCRESFNTHLLNDKSPTLGWTNLSLSLFNLCRCWFPHMINTRVSWEDHITKATKGLPDCTQNQLRWMEVTSRVSASESRQISFPFYFDTKKNAPNLRAQGNLATTKAPHLSRPWLPSAEFEGTKNYGHRMPQVFMLERTTNQMALKNIQRKTHQPWSLYINIYRYMYEFIIIYPWSSVVALSCAWWVKPGWWVSRMKRSTSQDDQPAKTINRCSATLLLCLPLERLWVRKANSSCKILNSLHMRKSQVTPHSY